ncbi:MAG: hypothetical protein QW594_03845 [Candidatus Woesearchaeota archaeon]
MPNSLKKYLKLIREHQEQHQESDWSSCLKCDRGTCPIRGQTKVQINARIARRKERVLALASTMLLLDSSTHRLRQHPSHSFRPPPP